ncbi:MAG: hypothetical protein AB8H79_13270 [Myxococcota bacterium]
MLRLTLLSGRDGRLLARVVESNGRPFVLDQGEPDLLEDVVQRLNHGFTVIRGGEVTHTSPDDPNVLAKLASYYAEKGALVFLEEPTWMGRAASGARLPSGSGVHPLAVPSPSPTVPPGSFDDSDDPTETVERSSIPLFVEDLSDMDTLLNDAPVSSEPSHRPEPTEDASDVDTEQMGGLPPVPRIEPS